MQIVAENLKFTYNSKSAFKKDALNGVTLTINEGDFFGIIGETGSGKSTFIQHLNGLIPLMSGSLKIGEYDLSIKDKKKRLAVLKEIRSKVGLVFQYPEYQLFAETCYEDIAFGLKNFYPKLTDKEVKERVINAINMVGLDESVLNKSPFSLSGGQKRRVAIAGILVTQPEILVLDEPVAGLDPVGKKQLMQMLHGLHNSQIKTIIIVSHDMDEVAENCNRVAVFSSGKVVKCLTVKELFDNELNLYEYNLDVPITAYLKNEIQKNTNIKIDTNYKTDNFIENLIKNL